MTDEILINTEAMNSVNKSVLSLKEKLTDILEEIKTQNNNFVSNSSGEFCNAFSQNAKMFEKFNIPAINKAIEENKIIRFSHNPNLNKYKNSYMYLEWSYLKNECQYTHLIQKGEYWYAVK